MSAAAATDVLTLDTESKASRFMFGSGKRYFGSVDGQHLLEDPDVVIKSNRVLHLRYRVRR